MLLALPAGASAHSLEVHTATATFGDLDLNRSRDRRWFDVRIREAVKRVCGSASAADLKGQNEVLECQRNTRATAARQRDVVVAGAGNPRSH